ncbi:MAG: NYN domain-containing protein [Candidatus Binatia bacterium]
MNNYAFIDGQNLHSGIKQLGWRIDHQKFVAYLRQKYHVTKAYHFVGYVHRNQPLYHYLRHCSYDLCFKPAIPGASGSLKGNVDADLVLQALIDFPNFDRAVIVSGDGDYYSLVRHLRLSDKLQAVLGPNRQYCSALLKREARGRLWFVEDVKHLVE